MPWVSGLGSRFSGLVFRAQGVEVRDSGPGFRVYGFGFRVCLRSLALLVRGPQPVPPVIHASLIRAQMLRGLIGHTIKPLGNVIAASIYDKYLVGLSIRTVFTMRCLAMTDMIQA